MHLLGEFVPACRVAVCRSSTRPALFRLFGRAAGRLGIGYLRVAGRTRSLQLLRDLVGTVAGFGRPATCSLTPPVSLRGQLAQCPTISFHLYASLCLASRHQRPESAAPPPGSTVMTDGSVAPTKVSHRGGRSRAESGHGNVLEVRIRVMADCVGIRAPEDIARWAVRRGPGQLSVTLGQVDVLIRPQGARWLFDIVYRRQPLDARIPMFACLDQALRADCRRPPDASSVGNAPDRSFVKNQHAEAQSTPTVPSGGTELRFRSRRDGKDAGRGRHEQRWATATESRCQEFRGQCRYQRHGCRPPGGRRIGHAHGAHPGQQSRRGPEEQPKLLVIDLTERRHLPALVGDGGGA